MVKGVVQLHGARASLFGTSVAAPRTVLKFDVCLGDHYLCFLHVLRKELIRTCAPIFLISLTAGRTVFKYGVLLETHYLRMHFT